VVGQVVFRTYLSTSRDVNRRTDVGSACARDGVIETIEEAREEGRGRGVGAELICAVLRLTCCFWYS
jgi:hypothetical protein